jgi:hypothetical protein
MKKVTYKCTKTMAAPVYGPLTRRFDGT